MIPSASCFIVLLLVIPLKCSEILAKHRCRNLINQYEPTKSILDKFNASIDGRLLRIRPITAACEGNPVDMNACNFVLSQWTNATWRSDQPGAMQSTNWENSSCIEEFDKIACAQGNIPEFGVNATRYKHVQETIRFANRYNLRLVIKTTGHDYLGRSTAPNSLLLWLHHMKEMTLIKRFQSCSGETITNAIRLMAGVQWGDVYKWLANYNLVAIGGASSTVGAIGGYLQGGGHGPLTRWQGMAVDQVLEFEIVTADGIIRRANECENADLFWALRGGGGGTYGVVLSAILRTYVSPSISAVVSSIQTEHVQDYQRILNEFTQSIRSLSDTYWSGYFYMSDQTLSFALLVPNGNHSENIALYNRLFPYKATSSVTIKSDQYYFASFYDFFRAIMSDTNLTGGKVLLGSRLIPETVVKHQTHLLARTFFQARGITKNQSLLIGHLVAGKQASTKSINTSLNPAWRKALLHMVYSQSLPNEPSNRDFESARLQIHKSVNHLEAIAGDEQSSYMNEADANEVDWQEKYFGPREHYHRLKIIKRNFDPNDLFICKNCVGSEDWTEDLSCRNNK